MSRLFHGAALGVLGLAAALAPAAAHADATVSASRRTELLDCGGGPALVNGDANRLVFHGNCASLRVNGGGNVVEIDLTPGGTVAIAGMDNHVLYTPVSPTPSVTALGAGNQVVAGTPGEASTALAPALPDAPPPPAVIAPAQVAPAATVVLDGEQQDRDIGCAGQNVLIRGSGGRFVLRGGCRSVSVQGRDDAIQAELVPGARIAIGGDAVTLNYTLTQDGPPPVVSVSGTGSQAMHVTRTSGPTVITQPGVTTVIGSD